MSVVIVRVAVRMIMAMTMPRGMILLMAVIVSMHS